MALISDEHANSIVWGSDAGEYDVVDIAEEETDRLFTFEVTKTNEQEENVTMRPGFTVSLSAAL